MRKICCSAHIKAIFSQIKKIAESGVTVLLVEQNARAALKLVDCGYVLEVVEIVFAGAAEELLSSKRIQDAYLGKQKNNHRPPTDKKGGTPSLFS